MKKQLAQQGVQEELDYILATVKSMNLVTEMMRSQDYKGPHPVFDKLNDVMAQLASHFELFSSNIEESIRDLHVYLRHLKALPDKEDYS